MIGNQDLMQTLMALCEQVRIRTGETPAVAKAEALIATQLGPNLNPNADVYLVALTQEEIGCIAGFIAPTTSEIDVNGITISDWEGLRERFPEHAFWECVETWGDEFYLGEV